MLLPLLSLLCRSFYFTVTEYLYVCCLSQPAVVREGYYLQAPGDTAPCPKGEYKDGFDAPSSCKKCANGVTTSDVASTAETDCRIVLPTFAPTSIVGGVIKSTIKCPQKYYCPGGVPTAAFNMAAPNNTTGTTVVLCPSETWTMDLGSSAADQCCEWCFSGLGEPAANCRCSARAGMMRAKGSPML